MGGQCKRVLRALQRHPEGVCQVDFLLPNVVDGGLPITRLAARIRDLRENGERIEVVGERHGCAVYKLAVAPVRAMPISVRLEPERPAADSTPQLFELPPRNAILGEEAA